MSLITSIVNIITLFGNVWVEEICFCSWDYRRYNEGRKGEEWNSLQISRVSKRIPLGRDDGRG